MGEVGGGVTPPHHINKTQRKQHNNNTKTNKHTNNNKQPPPSTHTHTHKANEMSQKPNTQKADQRNKSNESLEQKQSTITQTARPSNLHKHIIHKSSVKLLKLKVSEMFSMVQKSGSIYTAFLPWICDTRSFK